MGIIFEIEYNIHNNETEMVIWWKQNAEVWQQKTSQMKQIVGQNIRKN